MTRIKLVFLLVAFSISYAAFAQTGPDAGVDTVLMRNGIFRSMPDAVSVSQSQAVRNAVEERVIFNETSEYNGYRIRIYFDNSQNAREASSAIMASFVSRHPDMPAYRTFDSPNFKVTVGDFRTRSEALAALRIIQMEFPSAFIVREKFRFPSLPGEVVLQADTLQVKPSIGL